MNANNAMQVSSPLPGTQPAPQTTAETPISAETQIVTEADTSRQGASTFPYRKLLWKWHKLAGLFGAPLLIVISITGALLVFGPEIDHWLRPDLFQNVGETSTETRLSEQQMVDKVLAAYPPEKLVLIHQDPQAGLPNQYWLSSPDRYGFRHVWLNPGTGEINGNRLWESSFMRITEQLHRRLLTGETGSLIVEFVTGWGIVLALTGCLLWWPKTTKALQRGLIFRFRGSPYQINWRLHNVLGAWAGIILLLLCVTGMVFSSYSGKLYNLVMQSTGGQNLYSLSKLESTLTVEGTLASLDSMLSYVRRETSTEVPLVIYYPAKPTDAFLIIANKSHRPVWADRSNFRAYAFDQYSGALLDSSGWNDLHPLAQIRHLSLAIHYGSIFGLPTRAITVVACLAIPALALSGILIWWWKRTGLQKSALRRESTSKAPPHRDSNLDHRAPLPKWLLAMLVTTGVIFPTIGASFILLYVWQSIARRYQARAQLF